VIDRLQVSKGGAHFNNLLEHVRAKDPVRVDLTKHAASMGAWTREVRTLDELRAAFGEARRAGRTAVIVIRTDPNAWTGGDAWWDVGIPEVSEREEIMVARAEHDAERKHQRLGL
jgi:3D-(3,5/4)-trihydroxycyclohexane-1,2-dione acylhydrolase (decyclizing)